MTTKTARRITSASKALDLLRKPQADRTAGFYIWPDGDRVSDAVAQTLLGRNDIQPFDNGLLPGHPQSWVIGNWSERL